MKFFNFIDFSEYCPKSEEETDKAYAADSCGDKGEKQMQCPMIDYTFMTNLTFLFQDIFSDVTQIYDYRAG